MEKRNSGNGLLAFSTFLVGIVIGAAAVIYSDKDTRKRFEEKFDQLKGEGEHFLDEAKEKVANIKEGAGQKIEQVQEVAQKEIKKLRKDAANRIEGDGRG